VSAYYNEIDPYAAQWLRNLITAGHIAAGEVDERSIVDVRADDLRGFTQCHFFAGIGGWSYALRLAGWPDDRPVWTGSCPCQPFSAAGKQRGSDDERHLWPAFFRLISECCPGRVFGEQVAGAAGLAWLDHVCADLEGAGYAAAAANLCAAGAGAPHIRQRLYWLADADSQRRVGQRLLLRAEAARRHAGEIPETAGRGSAGLLGNAGNEGLAQRQRFPGIPGGSRGAGEGQAAERAGLHVGGLANAASARREAERATRAEQSGDEYFAGAWSAVEWIECSDGKARPTQPGLFPLAHGVSGRVGRLRAYGNAIVPQVAAAFIEAAA
jgi:DNA (cytosine-5)-methyltransferase 1